MRTKEEWLKDFTLSCFKANKYDFHPYGCMVVKPNKKEVVCFYPIISKAGVVLSFIVNTFKVKYLDADTWFRECANHNYAENCTRHRLYDIDKAFRIYCKYSNKPEKTCSSN